MKSILSLSAALVMAAALVGCSTNGSMKTGNGEACTGECSGDKAGCCESGAKKDGCCKDGAKKDGCCAEKKGGESASAVNQKCPYSGNPVNLSLTADYKGRTVAFCCAGCVNKWGKEIDADKDAMLAKAMAK